MTNSKDKALEELQDEIQDIHHRLKELFAVRKEVIKDIEEFTLEIRGKETKFTITAIEKISAE